MNRIALRNAAIILAIASLALVSQSAFGATAVSLNLILLVIFVAVVAYAGYRYIQGNELAWYVIPRGQRYVLIACAVALLVLLLVGFPLLGPVITPLGVIALMAALVLTMVWIVRESRRFR